MVQIKPKISVLLPVYNGEKYIETAIKSILDQSLSDFELIIINDGSTDNTSTLLQEYAIIDSRIKVITNDCNKGIVHSLNSGLAISCGEYIARQDADDISFDERLEKQMSCMDDHDDVGVLGTWSESIDNDGVTSIISRPPAQSFLIKWSLLFGNCMIHSSVLIRRSILKQLGGYDEKQIFAEDYDLWSRVSFEYRLLNLPEILVKHRLHSNRVSVLNSERQLGTVYKVMNRALLRILNRETPLSLMIDLHKLLQGLPLSDTKSIYDITSLILELQKAFIRIEELNEVEAALIRKDAASKLYILAGQNMLTSFWGSLKALLEAERIYPKIPSRKTFRKFKDDLLSRYKRIKAWDSNSYTL